ncbi:MAG: hypothetical protein ACE365_03215 [Gammaproteobacteria bacterium]
MFDRDVKERLMPSDGSNEELYTKFVFYLLALVQQGTRGLYIYYSSTKLFPTEALAVTNTTVHLWTNCLGRIEKAYRFMKRRHIPTIETERALNYIRSHKREESAFAIVVKNDVIKQELLDAYSKRLMDVSTELNFVEDQAEDKAYVITASQINDLHDKVKFPVGFYPSENQEEYERRFVFRYDFLLGLLAGGCALFTALIQAVLNYVGIVNLSSSSNVGLEVLAWVVAGMTLLSNLAFRMRESQFSLMRFFDQATSTSISDLTLPKVAKFAFAASIVLLSNIGLARFYWWQARLIREDYADNYGDSGDLAFLTPLAFWTALFTNTTASFFSVYNVVDNPGKLLMLKKSDQPSGTEGDHVTPDKVFCSFSPFAQLSLALGLVDAVFNAWGLYIMPDNNTFYRVCAVVTGATYFLFNVKDNSALYGGQLDRLIEEKCQKETPRMSM